MLVYYHILVSEGPRVPKGLNSSQISCSRTPLENLWIFDKKNVFLWFFTCVWTRVALGFATRRRVGRVSRVGSGRVGKSWPDGFQTKPNFSFFDPTTLTWLTYVGSDPKRTQHIGIVKEFLTYCKFSNPTRLVRRTDVGSDFNPTLHVGIVKAFLTRPTFSNPTRLTRPTDSQILTLPTQELYKTFWPSRVFELTMPPSKRFPQKQGGYS